MPADTIHLSFQDWLLGAEAQWWQRLGYDLAVIAVAFLGFISVLALLGIWAERKVSAMLQSRLGPNRVGPIGLLQSIADGIKLITKEDLMPRDADGILFRAAPYLAFVPVFVVFVALPFGPEFVFEPRLNSGIFFVLAMLSAEVIGVILAGWASNSKWSVFGAMREACQMVSYEIPLGMSVIVVALAAGTLNLVEISHQQSGGLHTWLLFRSPFLFVAFFVFFIASLASNKRAPFDLPESDSELVAGYHTEYSGLRFSLFYFAEYAAMFVVSAVATAIFLGGWNDPIGLIGKYHREFTESQNIPALFVLNLIAAAVFAGKAIALILLQMWIRWSLPRPRIDQVLYTCMKVLLPLSFILLLGTALWELYLPKPWGRPWVDFNPWDFRSLLSRSAVPLLTHVLLASLTLAAGGLLFVWIAYSFFTGRKRLKRLTDPSPIPMRV